MKRYIYRSMLVTSYMRHQSAATYYIYSMVGWFVKRYSYTGVEVVIVIGSGGGGCYMEVLERESTTQTTNKAVCFF
jgi:hypothetical protein